MPQMIYQVDAFTNQPFAGNPAGVCILNEPRSDSWLQDVAAEMNLSETAFVSPRPMEAPTSPGGREFDLRWFTPTQEMYLCGHATLSAAHILWQEGLVAGSEEARFHTLSGLLRVTQDRDWMTMDFPAWTSEANPVPSALMEGLGLPAGKVPGYFGRNDKFGMVVLDSPEQVVRLEPKFEILRLLPLDGIIVTAQGDGAPVDFVSRVFAPRLGINEDPVTGGAHCMLTPFWAERLGKTRMVARQVSKRGGELRVAPAKERVMISGQAVTVFSAQMMA